MGSHKCIVLGCKSRYKSGKNSKFKKNMNFFYIPKDGLELWKKAIARTDIVIKIGQTVCEKHFPKEDLVFRRELKGPNGQILGVSADFKTPRLRQGVVPTLHLGFLKVKKDVFESNEVDSNSMNEAEDTVTETESVYDQFEEVESDVDEKPSNKTNLEIREQLIDETRLEIPKETEDIPLFDIVFANEKSVALPPFWSRQNMKFLSDRTVAFNHFLPRLTNGIVESICGKQVIIDKNLDTNIFIMRHKIKKENSELKNHAITKIEDLEHLLKIVNIWKICTGFEATGEDLKTSFVRVDKEGTSRSLNCQIHLPRNSRSECCENCKRAKQVYKRKQLRWSKMPTLSRLRVSLNGPQQQKLDEMRREIKRLKKSRIRAVTKIETLKKLRIKDKQEFENSKKTLEELVCESKLEAFQKIVMIEMLSAAKLDNIRGRRYSKRWISFCLTLFKQSIPTYKYLRNNNVLPLPAPTTLFKFQQQNLLAIQNASKSDDKADISIPTDLEEFVFDNEIVPVELLPEIEMETEIS